MGDQTTQTRRSFLKATGGTAAAVATTGFAAAGSAAAQNQDGGQLELIAGTMTTMDPIAATDTESGRVIQQMFDGLTNYVNGQVTVDNLLATGSELSDDRTTWTFDIKEGATFHNGDTVTASDFVYAWERLTVSENSRRAYFVTDSLGIVHETDDEGNYQPGTLAVEAVDETTLQFELEQPFHSTMEILAYTSFAAVPEGFVGDVPDVEGEVDASTFGTDRPVGAGPFQFDRWDPGTDARVTAFGDYHGEGPQLSAVHWAIIEDEQAAYNYSMNRNADVLAIPTAQYDPANVSTDETDEQGREFGTYGPIRNGATVNYARYPEVSSYYFGFNTEVVPKPVRQAVAYATNQEEFAQQVFKNREDPAYHFTPPVIYPGGVDAYEQHVQEAYPYGVGEVRLQEARQVMEDAGYGPDNQFELQWTQYVSDTWRQIAQILRDRLSTAYIDMSIEEAQFATLLQRGRQGNLACYTLGWIADWPAPDNFLQLLYPPRTDTSQPAPISYTNWSETEAAQRAEEAYQTVLDNRADTDDAQQTRDEAYIAMEEANWEDAVFINTFHGVGEQFWYDNVDIPVPGGMGDSRVKYNTTTKSGPP